MCLTNYFQGIYLKVRVKNKKPISRPLNALHSSSLQRTSQLMVLKPNKLSGGNKLKWNPVWGIDLTINNTIDWYKNYYEKKIVKTDEQVENFIQDAQKNKIGWAIDVT